VATVHGRSGLRYRKDNIKLHVALADLNQLLYISAKRRRRCKKTACKSF